MTVHMIRLYIGPDTSQMTLSDTQSAWQAWVTNHSEWTADATSHTLSKTGDRGGTYWLGNCRFGLSDAKSNLITKCEDKFQNKCSWYRLGYHQCTHDESSPADCSWDDEREWTAKGVTIPGAVPDFL